MPCYLFMTTNLFYTAIFTLELRSSIYFPLEFIMEGKKLSNRHTKNNEISAT